MCTLIKNNINLYAVILGLVFFQTIKAQFLITAPNYTYTQNFGTTAISASGNNITSVSTNLTGWSYDSPLTSELNITATAPTNTGGRYAYTLNSNPDRKIGSRASGSTNDIEYGILFQNVSGQTIQSFSVSYSGFQISRGGNLNTDANTLTVDYKVSPSTMLVNATGTTPIPSLDFSQSQFVTTANTSSQGAGFPAAVGTGVNSGCISIATAIPNNSYLLLRWTDADDGGNDPHLAIDNVNVVFFTNQTVVNNTACSLLPIQLLDFYGTKNNKATQLVWNVAEEHNIKNYILEKSNNGIDFIELHKTLPSVESGNKTYYSIDEEPFNEITYYRLSTTEKDGNIQRHKIIAIENAVNEWDYTHYETENNVIVNFRNSVPKNCSIYLYDLSGKQLSTTEVHDFETKINTDELSSGIYFVKINSMLKTENFKILISK